MPVRPPCACSEGLVGFHCAVQVNRKYRPRLLRLSPRPLRRAMPFGTSTAFILAPTCVWTRSAPIARTTAVATRTPRLLRSALELRPAELKREERGHAPSLSTEANSRFARSQQPGLSEIRWHDVLRAALHRTRRCRGVFGTANAPAASTDLAGGRPTFQIRVSLSFGTYERCRQFCPYAAPKSEQPVIEGS